MDPETAPSWCVAGVKEIDGVMWLDLRWNEPGVGEHQSYAAPGYLGQRHWDLTLVSRSDWRAGDRALVYGSLHVTVRAWAPEETPEVYATGAVPVTYDDPDAEEADPAGRHAVYGLALSPLPPYPTCAEAGGHCGGHDGLGLWAGKPATAEDLGLAIPVPPPVVPEDSGEIPARYECERTGEKRTSNQRAAAGHAVQLRQEGRSATACSDCGASMLATRELAGGHCGYVCTASCHERRAAEEAVAWGGEAETWDSIPDEDDGRREVRA